MKLTLLTICVSTLYAADPAAGFWKVNPAKSKNFPARMSIMHLEEVTMPGGAPGFQANNYTIGADGKPAHSTFRYGLDGKDYPLADSAACDAFAAKRVNANTIERYCRKGGKTISTMTRKVIGGHAIQLLTKGTGPDGKPMVRETWYDKWNPAEAIAGHQRINVGTWKINPAKARREPPAKILVNGTQKSEPSGNDAIRVSSEGVGQDGKPYRRTNTYVLDGRDNPVTGMPSTDTLAMQLLDERTAIWTYKKGGQLRARAVTVFGADGSRTTEAWGTGEDGKPFHSVSVAEKQR